VKEKENQLQLYLDEFSEIRKNIVLLKPLFKRFIIIRGKADNFTEKKQFEKFIKISEDEYSCNIILPSVLQKENDNGLIDKKGENIFCSSNRIFLNHKVLNTQALMKKIKKIIFLYTFQIPSKWKSQIQNY